MSRAKKRVTDNTEEKLRNLRPFKPGQSGNPKGRPKGARNRLGTQFLEALEAEVIEIAKQDQNVGKHLAGQSVKRAIYVRGRIVNFVVGGA